MINDRVVSKMHNRKRKNMFIMIAAICTIMVMTTGYAILTQVIKVEGTVAVERDWDVRITGITDGSPTGAAANEYKPKFDDTTAVFTTLLYNKGDSMTYTVTIENFGSWDAQVNAISTYDTENPAIKFTITGVSEGDILESGQVHKLKVKVEYNSSFTGTLENNVGIIAIKLTYGQIGSEIIGGTTGDSSIYNPDLFVRTATDTLLETIVTSGDGMYEDPAEKGRYIFRGANPNNYIWLDLNGDTAKTDDEIYRIISLEGDNTIKVEAQTSIGDLYWQTKQTCDEIAYNYDKIKFKNGAFEIDNIIYTSLAPSFCNNWNEPAPIKTELNETFLETIDSSMQSKIIFHNHDIGPVSVSQNNSLSDDVTQEKTIQWNGQIALITVTDYVKASTNNACTNVYTYVDSYECYGDSHTHNYLFKSTGQWTLTPVDEIGSNSSYYIGDYGLGISSTIVDTRETYPSFYLTADMILSGEGTEGQPYTIVSWY